MAVLRRTEDGGRVGWTVEAAEGLQARIDPDDLTEALGALLENAARHASAAVQVSAAAAGTGGVRVAVRDDGAGIPEAELARLTGRGARLDLTGPGAGLGLAIAGEIADAAGGRLELANRAPGLEVALWLPAAARADGALTPGVRTTSGGRR